MKKLTAGIFTVLMGLVSVNAADAAVASKGYVDNKFFTKQAQTAHVEAQKAIDDAQDVKINENADDIATNAEKIGDATFTDDTLKYIKGEADLTAAVKKLDAAVTVASGDLSNVYTKTEADAKFIDTEEIKGYATDAELTDVSVVANAADTLSKTNQSAITVLNGDANTAGSVAKKINDATTTVTDAYTAADAETLNSAKGYTDTLANGAVAANTAAIAAINNDANGVLATAKKYADDQDAAQTTEITTAYEAADTATLNSAKAYTNEQIEALDLKAISRVPAACGTAGNYCVLTTNGTKFVWEVIVRDDTTLGEGDTGLYGDYSATEPAVTQ